MGFIEGFHLFMDDKPLNLNKSYEFDVTVNDSQQRFTGKLILSPACCTLRVIGERPPSKGFIHKKEVVCKSHTQRFTLFGLSWVHRSVQHLQVVDGGV